MMLANNPFWAVLLLILCNWGFINVSFALPLSEQDALKRSENNLLNTEIPITEKGLFPIDSHPGDSNSAPARQSIFSGADLDGRDNLFLSNDFLDEPVQYSKPYRSKNVYPARPNIQNNTEVKVATHTTSTGHTRLLDSLVEPKLKEQIKDTLESIKQVKEDLLVDKEISYDTAISHTNALLQNNLYLQEQQRLEAMRGINNKVSKEKYTVSMFQEFIDKVISFLLYAVLFLVLVKLLMMFIAWQRKLNQY